MVIGLLGTKKVRGALKRPALLHHRLKLESSASAFHQRHSDGAYLAGMSPAAREPRPRACAVDVPADVQAQSMAPVTPDASAAPCTLGLKFKVLPAASVGIPALVVLSDVTVMTPVAVSIVMSATYLDCFSLVPRALYSVAAAVTPARPSVWNASEIKLFGELAAITISETFERTV